MRIRIYSVEADLSVDMRTNFIETYTNKEKFKAIVQFKYISTNYKKKKNQSIVINFKYYSDLV